jgi:hypothetical protein
MRAVLSTRQEVDETMESPIRVLCQLAAGPEPVLGDLGISAGICSMEGDVCACTAVLDADLTSCDAR